MTFAVVVAYISLSVAKTIATALITNWFDYFNSLLYIIASKDILKLQCVQNCLARVVTRSLRFSHSVSLRKSLHWLPIQSRIILKFCTIAYQTLSSGEPSYLFSMLSLSPKPRELRSSGFHLFVPKFMLGLVLFLLLSLLFRIHPWTR